METDRCAPRRIHTAGMRQLFQKFRICFNLTAERSNIEEYCVLSIDPCPCGSGQMLESCCGQYFENLAAPTAESLMRSRYSAHVLGKAAYLGDTLTRTTSLASTALRSAVTRSRPVCSALQARRTCSSTMRTARLNPCRAAARRAIAT